jgi:hypothetical protein
VAISSSGRPLNDDKESQGSRSTRRRGRSPCGVPSPAALAKLSPVSGGRSSRALRRGVLALHGDLSRHAAADAAGVSRIGGAG